jgi:RHS repeat-associated protein
MDDENGLLYMRARYYDTGVGRFINKDPIGFAGGDLNLYAYVGNNPIRFVDPNGETFWVPAIPIVAGVLLAIWAWNEYIYPILKPEDPLPPIEPHLEPDTDYQKPLDPRRRPPCEKW